MDANLYEVMTLERTLFEYLKMAMFVEDVMEGRYAIRECRVAET